LASKAIEFDEKKRKIRAISRTRSSRTVSIESPYATLLLVINTNWHPI